MPILIVMSRDGVTTDGVGICSRICWTLTQLVTTNNYDSFTELLTPKIAVTAIRRKYFQSSLAVVW
jgi:hypothetical protein